MVNNTIKSDEITTNIKTLEEKLRLGPVDYPTVYNLGSLYLKENNFSRAVRYLKQAIKINPQSSLAYNNLGLCFKKTGDPDKAKDLFQKASNLDPQNHSALNNLIGILIEAGKYQKALIICKKAIKINPLVAVNWENLGLIHVHLENPSQAIKFFQKALTQNPNLPISYYSLGLLYNEQGKASKALENFQKAVRIDPLYYAAYTPLYLLLRHHCLWDEAAKIKSFLDTPGLENPWISVTMDDSPAKNYRVAKIRSQQLEKRVPKGNYHFLKKKRKEKIRLGYLSGDFREHPIGIMVASMFARHSRSQFNIFAYSYGKNDHSLWRKMIQKGADKFIDLRGIPDQKAADLIYKDKIDILVDLTGCTNGNRLEIFVTHPAPVQITWLGHPGTSGANFFDYVVADKIVVPQKDQKYYSEKIIYLPHCYQINNNQLKLTKKEYLKTDFGLPEKGFIFSCFNQPYKIDKTIWEVWMKILKKVPGSILWLWDHGPAVSRVLKEAAKMAGVDPHRLFFAKRFPKEEHLKRLTLADLGLDTLIYGGHTTTSDCLWADVPVVTKTGPHFASRVCTSILAEAGIPEMATKSLEEYEQLAIHLAKNPEVLADIKRKITQAKLKKNLFDTTRFVINLEKAYKIIWSNYQKGQKPKVVNLK
jgi:protein O-GlcNAc transferase